MKLELFVEDDHRVWSHWSETSQKERTNIVHELLYVECGKKWYRRTYFQGKNRDADVENGQKATVGKWKAGQN